MKRRAGFSLTELIVVVGVIVILTSLLLPSVNYFRDNLNLSRDLANLRQLHTAWMAAATDQNGIVPPAYVIKAHPFAAGAVQKQHWPGRLAEYLGYSATIFGPDQSVYMDAASMPANTPFRNAGLKPGGNQRKMISYAMNIVGIGTYVTGGAFTPPCRLDGSAGTQGESRLAAINGSTIAFATGSGAWHLGNFNNISKFAGKPYGEDVEASTGIPVRHPWGGKGAYVRVNGSAFTAKDIPPLTEWVIN